MKEEIKFRAWNGKELLYKGYLDIETGIYQEDEGAEIWKNRHTFKVMQYTGIKDKNGVECYEGDLVEIKDKQFVVEWYKEYVGFRAISGKLCLNMYSNEFEIKGNIYENKELIYGSK